METKWAAWMVVSILAVTLNAFGGADPAGLGAEARGVLAASSVFSATRGDVPAGQRAFSGSSAGADHRARQDGRQRHRAAGSSV